MENFIILEGLIFGLALIIGIGAQNYFVLKSSLKGQHLFLIANICILLDLVLIALGIFGIGNLVKNCPMILQAVKIIGFLVVTFYALIALKDAFFYRKNNKNYREVTSKKKLVITLLMITLFNPQTYIDTVFIIGSFSSKFEILTDKAEFLVGCMLASIVWFYSLAFGAHKFAYILLKERVWRTMSFIISMIMFYISYNILLLN